MPGEIKHVAYGGSDGAPLDGEVDALCRAASKALSRALDADYCEDRPDTGSVQEVFETAVAMETDREGLRTMAAAKGHCFADPISHLLSRAWTADAFTGAIFGRKRIVNATARFMDQFDLYLTPAVATTAFPAGLDAPVTIGVQSARPTDWTRFSALANLTGYPAVSIPVGVTSAELSACLQIMGEHLADRSVISAARLLE
jgi:aspartyl-tRNA(Asn)/glutamyl-tRNA(Gln) amidotransferase subunit A